MQQIKQFLQGKKTYLSAALIALVACFGWWFGVIGDTEALSLLGVAGAAAGLGAKSERTSEAILTVLRDMRQVQATSAVGQKIDPKTFVADLSKQLMSQFAQGGLMRSTPGGAASNVVPTSGETFVPTNANPATCFYCGLALSANGGVCDSPLNGSAIMTNGRRGHVVVTFAPGGTAK